jgi:ectoine hydroxylase-related dioxygenase (phytanoyl-CoA dioxygenase family)
MNCLNSTKEEIDSEGFAVIDNVFTNQEVDQLLQIISNTDSSNLTFRKSKDLFAIRQFFKELPEALDITLNEKLKILIAEIFGDHFFIVKSIYFDKPEESNWFVSWHQDLTISVNKKIELEGFALWTKKQNQFAVHPPVNILQDNFTIRIHLDDTDEHNGALKIIPKSHLKNIYRPETIDWSIETEKICRVKKGGLMFMKPLLLHSSGRTTNSNKRRVIHIECSRSKLPNGLHWSEFLPIRPIKNKKSWPNQLF